MERWLAQYVEFSARRSTWMIALFALLIACAVFIAMRLELHTDLTELLPPEHPSARALRTVSSRQKSATNLVLLIESPDPDANRRFVDALKPALQPFEPQVFSEIQWRPETETRDYAEKWRWLYMSRADLQEAERLLDRAAAQRRSPLWVDLDGDANDDIKAFRQRMEERLPAKREGSYFATPDGQTFGVMLWRQRDGLGSSGDHQAFDTLQHVVADLNPAHFHPQMRVRYTGHIAQAIDEQNGIRDDLTFATVMCTSLILLVIYLYFRRIPILVVIGAPAALGLLLALACARLHLGYLNVNTAFLISIILGNGINTPIVVLARYGEERRKTSSVQGALARALAKSWLGTASAMLAASVSYGALIFTRFRGFNQFGFLGGIGMLLVWVSSFLLIPPLILTGERHWPGCLTSRGRLWQTPFRKLAQLITSRRRATVALVVAALLVAAFPLARYARNPLEWNFANLRSAETESQRLWPKMEALGMGGVGAGYIANTAVLLVDRPDQAEPVAAALRERSRSQGGVIGEVRTIGSLLPSEQDEKLQMLSRLRAKIARNLALTHGDEHRELESLRPPDTLRVLTVDDLPRQVRESFTEVDGTRGRLIGIDADPKKYHDWNGHDLLRLADALQVDAAGKHWVAASAATVFAGMLEMLLADGPVVTALALAGVCLLVLFTFGVRDAVPVLLALAIGLVWLGGCLGVLALKLNFMNFVAIPITFGVGVDYAANIWSRLRAESTTGLQNAVAETGSAVALCSLTTIIGYSSLLFAGNRALRSFGLLADLGEVTCLSAALVVLPLIAERWQRRQRRQIS